MLKHVRKLTRKMLQSTNFEKMKVETAVKLFRSDVIAALEFMQTSGDADFKNSGATIDFMKTVKR